MGDVLYVLIYGLIFASLYGIMTVGFSLVCGLGGFYDITLPAYFMVGAFLIVKLGPILGDAAVLIVAPLLGILCLIHYLVVIRPQREDPYRIFFATILLALAVDSLMAEFFKSGYTYKIQPLIAGNTELLGTEIRNQLILGGVIAWAALFGLRYVTRHTNVGRAIIGIPQSSRGSQVIGLDVVRIQMVVYFVGGLLLGIGAYFYGGYIGVSTHMWVYPLIIMFTITTVGGMGSIGGVIWATLLIGILEVLVVTFIDPRLRGFIILGIAIIILLFRPKGIAGVRIG
jgi:branched-chain amino acid transport system permease protein